MSLSVSAVFIRLKPCTKFLRFRAVDTMPGAGRRRKCPGINGESKGTSARHAQDQSAHTDQAAKDLYAAQTVCVQISEPVAAGL